MIRIRLLSAPAPPGWTHPDVVFDPDVPPEACDGLLAWGAITDEFLNYRGPRAWYISEPLTHNMFRSATFRRARRNLGEHEFLHHSNPNPKYRYPAVTHYVTLAPAADRTRVGEIVATVNDFGGRIWWLRPHLRFRTRFLLNPNVTLFGSAPSWSRFRRWPWSRPHPPDNYRGETSAPNCWTPAYVDYLAQYRANLCFENAILPYWFTEKFVNAARAGCVPVYHAHPVNAATFLRGATWIDPADHGFDIEATLDAARRCDAAAIRAQNYQWLQSAPLAETEGYAVWTRIANLFVERAGRS
ncbi:MAG TPA: hypothetical protein VG871_07725 [Vicinamibacterales bacterium]|jgi:hypothetical protein|nr:hypothetical protein [Vicinamibacterales bacterium]